MAEKPAIRTVAIPMICPTHKNQLHPSKHGGLYLDQRAKKQRDALMLYLKSGLTPIGGEWSCRLEMNVDLDEGITTVTLIPIELYDHRRCPDTDGMATAMMDSIQKSGVLKNDGRIRQLLVMAK